jgi:hypothetical protein
VKGERCVFLNGLQVRTLPGNKTSGEETGRRAARSWAFQTLSLAQGKTPHLSLFTFHALPLALHFSPCTEGRYC